MRIAHIIWGLPIGGIETMLVEILNRQCLTERITLIIVNDLVNENLLSTIHKNVKIIRINRPPGSRNVYYFFKVWRVLAVNRPKVIHCHGAGLYKFLLGLRKKACLTVHDVGWDPKSFKHYHKLFAISQAVRDYIFNETKIEAELIYNGIDFRTIKEKENYVFKTFRILQISRLEHTKKGQDILINALKYLVYDLGIVDVQLDLIGGGSSLEYLKKIVAKNNLNEHVFFRGEIDKENLYNMISDYNLLVQPSLWEGFGLTVAEGMVAKVPVLVSNIDGPLEIIKNGDYGDVFKSNDFIDCALKIQHIIKNYSSYTTKERLQKIYNYTTENFDISMTTRNYLDMYKKHFT